MKKLMLCGVLLVSVMFGASPVCAQQITLPDERIDAFNAAMARTTAMGNGIVNEAISIIWAKFSECTQAMNSLSAIIRLGQTDPTTGVSIQATPSEIASGLWVQMLPEAKKTKACAEIYDYIALSIVRGANHGVDGNKD